MPPLAIAAALSSALIHASWNAALKGGRDRVTDTFLIAMGGIALGLAIIAVAGAPRTEAWPYLAASVTIHLYVEDADAFVARAEKAGAKVTMPVGEMFWGDRYGVIEDPFGHQWSVGTHVRDVSMEEAQQAMQKMAGGS